MRTVKLSIEDIGVLRNQQVILEFQRSLLKNLESIYTREVEMRGGIDLTNEKWELDLDRGLLTQTDPD